MPATNITNSANIASLDSKIVVDECAGNFYTDITPSIWIGTGYNNVLGASVQIVNPYGVIIKNYPTSGYDIYPPMSSVVTVAIPTQAGNYQYGQYSVNVQLTDANGTVYTVSKQLTICAPNPQNKTVKYGSLSAQLNGVCSDGKVYVIADAVPTYNGIISNSQVNTFTLSYPTVSGLPVVNTTIGSFSVVLFEGQYIFSGTICANYNYGDNISVKVSYQLYAQKDIRCLIDESCIAAQLAQLNSQLQSDCTDAEKEATKNTIIQTLLLVKIIETTANGGMDASNYINQLEQLLGCVCTCNCAVGTPIINNSPNKDFQINGCNVSKTTVGLTDTYQIDNYAYVVAVTDNGGVITISAPVLADCTQTQTLTFNIAPLYSQIKNQINNSTEYNYWASILNKSWDSLDISCLVGVTQDQWNVLSYAQRSQLILDQLCLGANCGALISSNSTVSSAADVVVSWTNSNAEVFEVSAYIDDLFAGTALYPSTSFKFLGAADGNSHTYKLYSKCSNGSLGNLLQGSFTYYGCAYIAAPTVSSTSVSDAACPYNLTTLVSGLPLGISQEWHTLNSTSAASLVANPTNAVSGSYYVFAKDVFGCYSLGVNVILSCSSATNCSAPQTLIVQSIVGGYRVRFQSAAYPPPLNSYTVKRRLSSDPDVSGSYTTIGTPTWNSSVNRWEILDTGATDNTLYVYRAISNCTSSAPYVDYQFANITCPVVTLTPHDNSIDYSFTNVGGGVDKYEVKIYSSDGITLIHTDTILPVFSTPITGTFIYLELGTTYIIQVTVYIGTYSVNCAQITETTTSTSGKNVIVVNNTSGYISLQFDLGSQTFGPLGSGTIALTPGGYIKNTAASSFTFIFLTSWPSTSDPDESPNPDVLAASASHTLHSDLTNLNYIKVDYP